jgi:hypothetical protein
MFSTNHQRTSRTSQQEDLTKQHARPHPRHKTRRNHDHTQKHTCDSLVSTYYGAYYVTPDFPGRQRTHQSDLVGWYVQDPCQGQASQQKAKNRYDITLIIACSFAHIHIASLFRYEHASRTRVRCRRSVGRRWWCPHSTGQSGRHQLIVRQLIVRQLIVQWGTHDFEVGRVSGAKLCKRGYSRSHLHMLGLSNTLVIHAHSLSHTHTLTQVLPRRNRRRRNKRRARSSLPCSPSLRRLADNHTDSVQGCLPLLEGQRYMLKGTRSETHANKCMHATPLRRQRCHRNWRCQWRHFPPLRRYP